MTRLPLTLAATVLALAIVSASVPARARATARPAVNRPQESLLCKGASLLSGLVGTACTVASHPKTLLHAGKTLITGHPGKALKTVLGDGSKAASAAVGLAAVVAWVSGGAKAALDETAKLVGESSRPDLSSTWFSSAYWRVAAVSALLTLPFLFAAAIQSLLRSDLTLLLRAAFGYLPLGMLAVGVAAPLAMLLLAASDEMSAIVSTASGNAGTTFLGHAGLLAAAINPFVSFFVALLTVAGAVALWLELLVREAAVYVIVLMLPLFFAALVWPARRVWAVRAVELLIALILSKFVIVAVLSLGGAALAHAAAVSISSLLAGLALVLLAAFSPWAVMRLLPLHEMASAAVAGMGQAPLRDLRNANASAGAAVGLLDALPSRLHAMAGQARERTPAEPPSLPAPAPSTGADPPSPDAVDDAAEEAATAVASSGAPAVATPTAAGDVPMAGPDPAPGDAADGRQLTAESARDLPELWHRPWGPITLGPDMDPERPVDGSPPSRAPEDAPPATGPSAPTAEPAPTVDVEPPMAAEPAPTVDVEPPTLPDTGPLPPPDQDAP